MLKTTGSFKVLAPRVLKTSNNKIVDDGSLKPILFKCNIKNHKNLTKSKKLKNTIFSNISIFVGVTKLLTSGARIVFI